MAALAPLSDAALAEGKRRLAEMGQIAADDHEFNWRDHMIFPAFTAPSRTLWQSAVNYPLTSFSNLKLNTPFWRPGVDQSREIETEFAITRDFHWESVLPLLRTAPSLLREAWVAPYYRASGTIPDISPAQRANFSRTVHKRATTAVSERADVRAALAAAAPSVEVSSKPVTAWERFKASALGIPVLYLGMNVEFFMIYAVLLGPPLVAARAAWYNLTSRPTDAALWRNIFRMGRMRRAFEGDVVGFSSLINPFVRANMRIFVPKGIHIGIVFTAMYFLNLQWVWGGLTAAADGATRRGYPVTAVALRTIRDAVPDHLYLNHGEAAGLLTALFYARRPASLCSTFARKVGLYATAGFAGALAGAAHQSKVFPFGDSQLPKRLPLWLDGVVRGTTDEVRAQAVKEERVGDLMRTRPGLLPGERTM